MIVDTTIASGNVLADIQPALKAPFDPADIDFLPKNQFEKDGQVLCVAMPYADKRVYEDRLNTVCPGEWFSQASVTVAGSNKVITLVTVTVRGVPHTDIGESFLTGMVRGELKEEENTATESFAQAFKRACSQFGLGRFLYALDKQYLPYDKAKKRITLSENERKGLVRQMYKKAGLLEDTPVERGSPVGASENGTQGNQRADTRAAAPAEPDPNGPMTQQQLASISKLCKNLNNKHVDRPGNYGEAHALIAQLSEECRQQQAS